MESISSNLEIVRKKIREAALRCRRKPEEIKLIAVGKTHTADAIKEAYETGQRIFGENYVQELEKKAESLSNLDIEWHYLGHLQRNKVKHVLRIARCIHSLDSIRLAEEIEKRSEAKMDCLIEVNLAGESSKTGVPKDRVIELTHAVKEMKNINLIGLMTMPPYDFDQEKSRPYFSELKSLMNEINGKQVYVRPLTELSMGMSGDYEAAVQEGATMLRIGTAIFGERI